MSVHRQIVGALILHYKLVFVFFSRRIKWWVESAVPTMHSYELNPPSATCFADYRKEASYAFVNMTFRDFTGVFFMYLAACAVALVLFVLEVAVGRPAA